MPDCFKLVSVVGARPQFVKLAPVLQSLEQAGNATRERVVNTTLHTGQHYDDAMSKVFFDELELPRPDVNLNVGSGPHGRQTGEMLAGIEQVLTENRPNLVMVYGDTNSTVAGALAAAKLNIPVAHVESGLRSFDRRMPEEINRVVTDHISDLLLAPTRTAMENLESEGLAKKAVLTGDVMLDAIQSTARIATQESEILSRLALSPNSYGLVTVHRAENTDDRNRLEQIIAALETVASSDLPLVFPIHPRTRGRLSELMPDWSPCAGLQILDPVGYLDMLCLTKHAKMILTDSGGLQKEALFLGRPCVTLRDRTEWVETVEAGMNLLTGADEEAICDAVRRWNQNDSTLRLQDALDKAHALYGHGRAADRITTAVIEHCRSTTIP